MKPTSTLQFHFGRAMIGSAVGAALCVTINPATGIPIGAGLAVVFGLMKRGAC